MQPEAAPEVAPELATEPAVTAAQFAAAMAPFRLSPQSKVAVAVSGGVDSLALTHLLVRWAGERRVVVHGLTVDHQLRDAAAAEAEQVGRWLGRQAVPHTILHWNEGPQAREWTGSAQSAARDARYGLMTDWCAVNDCSHLFLAHHADDQVETFLLRLARGSGVDGLAAMASASVRDGIVVARPLLGFSKLQLMAVCRALEQPWIEDPSNQNSAGARVRFRQAQQILEREGLTRSRLLATVGHLQRARAALEHSVGALLDWSSWDDFGSVRLPLGKILDVPEEIALRALARLLTAAGGQVFGPRFDSLARLYARLVAGPWSDATLHGCLVNREGAEVHISREPAQITDQRTLSQNTSVVWDRRFKLTMAADVAATFTVARWPTGALLPGFDGAGPVAIPVRLREVLPALLDSRGIAAVPHLGYRRADIAEIPGFRVGVIGVSGLSARAPDGDAKL